MPSPSLPQRLAAMFRSVHIDGIRGLEEMRSCYTEDMRFVDPIQDLHGREDFYRTNARLLRHSRDVRFEDIQLVGDEPHFMIRWTMVFRLKVGPEFVIPGVSEFRAVTGPNRTPHWPSSILRMLT